MSVLATVFAPLAGSYATNAAKKVVNRIIEGNGTEAEIRKAEIELAAIDAQAAVGQRSARPYLQAVAGLVIIVYVMMTVIGIIYNSFVEGATFQWMLMYTDAYLVIGWAITYTTGIGGLRAMEKHSGNASNHSVADKFNDTVRNVIVPRKPNKPAIKTRTDKIRPIDDFTFDVDLGPDDTYAIDSVDFQALDMQALEFELRADEGERLEIYYDTEGFKTAGIGHKLIPTDAEYDLPVGTPITKERAEFWFNRDFQIAIMAAERVVQNLDALPADAQAVLINMAFQLGEKGLSKFKLMLEAIQDRDWHAAAAEALDSKWAKQTPKRAERMAKRLRALA